MTENTVQEYRKRVENQKCGTLSKSGFYMPKWREDIGRKRNIEWFTDVSQIKGLSHEERTALRKVNDAYGFRANSYYLSLIDWDDPSDPIRKIVVPNPIELEDISGSLDASLEHNVTVVPGCEHKYAQTALILVSRVCGALCRFCFRKRLFSRENTEISPDLEPAFEYIRSHNEISNVLLTGGDSFILPTEKIASILRTLRAIPHVRAIRFGSKLPAFNPYRFIDDPELLDVLQKHSSHNKRIYLISHFNHPREVTDVAMEAVGLLIRHGIIILNQTPLIEGINSNPEVLGELFSKLTHIGIAPYYVFQCRPTRGNAHFMTSLEESIDIVEKAKRQVSGLGKRARLAGSHATGKIEILFYDNTHIYFKYHQSKDPRYHGQAFKLLRKENARWWDDWMPDRGSFSLDNCPDAVLMSGSV